MDLHLTASYEMSELEPQAERERKAAIKRGKQPVRKHIHFALDDAPQGEPEAKQMALYTGSKSSLIDTIMIVKPLGGKKVK